MAENRRRNQKTQRRDPAREKHFVNTETTPFSKAIRNVLVKGASSTEKLSGDYPPHITADCRSW